jgi:hypothetical protein
MASSSKNEKSKLDYVPSHNMTSKYAILQEFNDKEMETWLYFIKYDGNEENLKHLKKQFDSVEWVVLEDCSVFDIDLEHLISAKTAKEMTKVELNVHQWHRKFDGTLEKIDFEFKKKDDSETKICKIFDHLGYGQIEDYISDEDLDEEDLTDAEDSDNEDDDEDDSDDNEDGDSDDNEDDDDDEKKREIKRIPKALLKSKS